MAVCMMETKRWVFALGMAKKLNGHEINERNGFIELEGVWESRGEMGRSDEAAARWQGI